SAIATQWKEKLRLHFVAAAGTSFRAMPGLSLRPAKNHNYSHHHQLPLVMPSEASSQQILVIEDDTILGMHLKTSLEQRGFQVTLAADGDTGLRLANGPAYDLIVLDVLLPQLDGMNLLTRLRGECRTPVLMMSALSERTVEMGQSTGVSLGAITEMVSTIQAMNQQIATAAEQQASVASELSRSVENIR